MNQYINKKILFFALFFGALEGAVNTFYAGDFSMTYMVLLINFSDFKEFNAGYLTTFMLDMIPRICAQILYGFFIYQHFGTANAYVFTRRRDRSKWFVQEAFHMFAGIVLYEAVYYCSKLFCGQISTHPSFSLQAVLLLILAVVFESIYIFIIAMVINLVSVVSNSMYGFAAGMGIQLMAAGELMAYEHVAFTGIWKWLFRLNPIANMILSWHSFPLNTGKGIRGIYYPIWFSALYYIILLVVLLPLGVKLIRRDIISSMRT